MSSNHFETVIQYLPRLVSGAGLTLSLGVISLLVAIVIGIAGANARLSSSKLLQTLAGAYSTIVRGIPDLVWMYLVYYGVQFAVLAFTEYFNYENVIISPFAAGVITLSFIFGAFFTETFRGAMLAIPSGQIEAGVAIGMSRWDVLWRITFPQMLRYALPGIKNNWLTLSKATALVSIIGLDDLVQVANQTGRALRMTFAFNLACGALYLVITAISLLVFKKVEQYYRRGISEVRYE